MLVPHSFDEPDTSSWSEHPTSSCAEALVPDSALQYLPHDWAFDTPTVDSYTSTSASDVTFPSSEHQGYTICDSESLLWGLHGLEEGSNYGEGCGWDTFGSSFTMSQQHQYIFEEPVDISAPFQQGLGWEPILSLSNSPDNIPLEPSSPTSALDCSNLLDPSSLKLYYSSDSIFTRFQRADHEPWSPFSASHRHPIARSDSSRTRKPQGFYRSRTDDYEKVSTNPKDLRRHTRTIHGRERWKCRVPNCERGTEGFSRKANFLHHMSVHTKAEKSKVGPELTMDHPYNLRPLATLDSAIPHFYGTKDKCNAGTQETSVDSRSDHGGVVLRSDLDSKYKCPILGCAGTFVNQHDLGRHRRTVHIDLSAGEGYRCSVEGCSKSDKIWSRLDNFKTHLKMQHKLTDIDRTVQLSLRGAGDNAANAPFAITTPETFLKSLQKSRTS